LSWPHLTLELEHGIRLLSKQFHIVNILSTRGSLDAKKHLLDEFEEDSSGGVTFGSSAG